MTLSQTDNDNGPDEQTHDLKQQNVTTISTEAELFRSVKSHGDLQVLAGIGPWTQRHFVLVSCWFSPVQREAPHVLVHCWQTETPSG